MVPNHASVKGEDRWKNIRSLDLLAGNHQSDYRAPWRALNALGFWLPMYIKEGETVYYMSFYKASLLFFIAAIASSNYVWFKSQKH